LCGKGRVDKGEKREGEKVKLNIRNVTNAKDMILISCLPLPHHPSLPRTLSPFLHPSLPCPVPGTGTPWPPTPAPPPTLPEDEKSQISPLHPPTRGQKRGGLCRGPTLPQGRAWSARLDRDARCRRRQRRGATGGSSRRRRRKGGRKGGGSA
jgi:hypothetical protein